MSIQNSIINSYYKSATEVKLLENDPKVVEYLRAVKARESAKQLAIEEMAKQKIIRTEGKSTYREYRFGDKVVELRITMTHIKPVEEHDEPRKYLSVK